jgi:hypothetical protein
LATNIQTKDFPRVMYELWPQKHYFTHLVRISSVKLQLNSFMWSAHGTHATMGKSCITAVRLQPR